MGGGAVVVVLLLSAAVLLGDWGSKEVGAAAGVVREARASCCMMADLSNCMCVCVCVCA